MLSHFPWQIIRACSLDLCVENDELDLEFNSGNKERYKRYGGNQWLFVLCTPIIEFYWNKRKHGPKKTVYNTVNVLQSIKAFYWFSANDMIFPRGSTSTWSFFPPQKCYANLSCSFFKFFFCRIVFLLRHRHKHLARRDHGKIWRNLRPIRARVSL